MSNEEKQTRLEEELVGMKQKIGDETALQVNRQSTESVTAFTYRCTKINEAMTHIQGFDPVVEWEYSIFHAVKNSLT